MSGTNNQVARVRTQASVAEWADAIAWAWRQLLPTDPTVDALAVLWAQYALETGRGKSAFAWNLGNIKRVPGDGYDYTVLRTFEYIDGVRVDMDDTFRAYPSLREGAIDYLRFLTRAAYAGPWARVVAGDAAGFAHALKVRGYYTAPENEYTAGLVSLANEFRRSVSEVPPPDTLRDTEPAPPAVPVEVPAAVDFVATLADKESA